MEALLPDHGRSVAGRGIEGGHRRVEKDRRGNKAKNFEIFEGRGGCRLGGEMGGRGVDCVLEKVFNPQGTGCGVEDPGQRIPAEICHIGHFDQKIGCCELAECDPHMAPSTFSFASPAHPFRFLGREDPHPTYPTHLPPVAVERTHAMPRPKQWITDCPEAIISYPSANLFDPQPPTDQAPDWRSQLHREPEPQRLSIQFPSLCTTPPHCPGAQAP